MDARRCRPEANEARMVVEVDMLVPHDQELRKLLGVKLRQCLGDRLQQLMGDPLQECGAGAPTQKEVSLCRQNFPIATK